MTLFAFSRKYCSGWLHGVFRLKRIGEENIPKDGPFIVCSNHRSNFDPVILGCTLRHDLFFMAKAELFKVPLLKQLITSFGAFPVHRGKNDVSAIIHANKLVKAGKVLTMFPEGTRQKEYGEPQRFKSGAALLAFKTHAPVLPVAIATKGRVRLFKRNVIVIGKPISYEELGFTTGDSAELREVSKRIRDEVAKLMNDAKD